MLPWHLKSTSASVSHESASLFPFYPRLQPSSIGELKFAYWSSRISKFKAFKSLQLGLPIPFLASFPLQSLSTAAFVSTGNFLTKIVQHG